MWSSVEYGIASVRSPTQSKQACCRKPRISANAEIAKAKPAWRESSSASIAALAAEVEYRNMRVNGVIRTSSESSEMPCNYPTSQDEARCYQTQRKESIQFRYARRTTKRIRTA